MPHFTPEQLAELATVFNLQMPSEAEFLLVRDGYVRRGQQVWWRCNEGPALVNSDSPNHWANIRAYPQAYQLSKPKVKPSKFPGYDDE